MMEGFPANEQYIPQYDDKRISYSGRGSVGSPEISKPPADHAIRLEFGVECV